METTKLALYNAEVTRAADKLAEACNAMTGVEVNLVTVKAAHVHVRAAHKQVKHACRIYRRRIWWSRFILWGEYEAVAMGYMRFDEVDKTP